MLYAIIGEDVADGLEKRQSARPAHLERLKALQDEGRLVLAGPFPAVDSPDPGPAGFSGGHYRLTIVSDAFAGKSLVQRHRLVYETLDDLLKQNEIHALSIKAYTAQEI